ncbi:MAG: agmatine deiminase family protein, partial [Aquiluna sp.]|nr:agmatine deiminase family protein [Aquiluna sp.]
MTHLMPAEWEAHEQTLLAFPHSGYTLGESAQDQEVARQAWANVANAASEFEKVTVIVHPEDLSTASKLLSAQIETFESVLDDAWIRDSGPTFVRTTDGALAAVNWVFNGWGGQAWASYENDNLLATKIANSVGVPVIDSKMVNEGGGIHFNGQGKVLLTETVQLDKGRNPGWDKAQVEAELKRTIGAEEFIWLKRGLTRDYDEFGTRGHVDIVACFAPDGRVIYHDQQDQNHPDYLVSREVREQLISSGLELISVPAPETLKDDGGFVDY